MRVLAQARPPAASSRRIRVWFNPRLESREFMVPGVLALLLLVITANLSSMGVVREKEMGTLEQLNVTPLRRWELIRIPGGRNRKPSGGPKANQR